MDAPSPFPTRLETFSHGGFSVELLLPRSPDELIDLSEFNDDERLPYWAELWPSARALARHLLDGPAPAGRAVELGCGVALPCLALAWRGVPALATDYYLDALRFARLNAERNGLAPPATRLLDWRHPPAGLGRFDLILGADLLYERRNAEALAALLPRLAAPGAEAWIADPGRAYARELLGALRSAGWAVEEAARYLEPAAAGSSPPTTVRILRLRPGGTGAGVDPPG